MTANGVTAFNDDLAIGRAVYGDAHRRGDALATARAAARLRAHIADLDAAELAAVRSARQRFGKAIREARSRRLAPPVRSVHAVARPLRGSRRLPLKRAAVLALLALLLAAVAAEPLVSDRPEAGGGAPAADAADPIAQPVTLSRGRVVLAVAAVEPVAAPAAEPAPLAEPAPEASLAPTISVSTGQGGGVPGGSGAPGAAGTGSGGGSGAGTSSPAPAATRTPAPTFATCFATVQRGQARVCGQVIDARTGRGLPGVCVSQGPCKATSAITDPNGRYTFQLVVGNGLVWYLEFAKAGYGTALYTEQNPRAGRVILPTQFLSPN